jgi:hypothetical protein
MASKVIAPETGQPERALTALDRCDHKGCGAQAYVRVTLSTGELYFCGHDFAAVEMKLSVTAQHIDDQRWRLLARPQAEDSSGLV